jgi:hypothetical protein
MTPNGKREPLCQPPRRHLAALALRREAVAIRQQTVYGLVIGWVLTLCGGFLYFCVISSLNGLWIGILAVGILHLASAVLLPQALALPERAWRTIAHWQGRIVMSVLLTLAFFLLIWPASLFDRRRASGFATWTGTPPKHKSAWQPIERAEFGDSRREAEYRSLPVLLAAVIGFFLRRGNYVLVAVVILLLMLGLTLYFVESSALAPFIYTLF